MKPIAWVCLVVAVACMVGSPVLDPDLWWHIVVGRWILAHETFPVVDYWNQFGAGTPWYAYSWLFEVAVAAIDRQFGNHGLLVAQLALLGASCGVFCSCYRRLSKSWFAGTYLGVIVTFAMTQHFALRPQVVVWALEAVVIVIAFDIVDRGLRRSNLLALVLAMCAWANLHITTAYGLGIAGSILLGAAPLPAATVALLTGLLATLLTPYVGQEWWIFLDALTHPQRFPSIGELQPATILEVPTLFVVLLVVKIVMAGSRQLRSWPPLLLVGAAVMTLTGLAITKFLPMALVLLAAIVARSLGAPPSGGGTAVGAWERFREIFGQLEKTWDRLPSPAVAVASLVLAAVFFLPLWGEPILKSLVPVDLVDRIVTEDFPQPILNDFGRGGYLMYRYADEAGEPRHLVPIDGRGNLLPAKRMEQYMDMAAGAENWREFFDAVGPRTVIFQTDSPLVAILLATGNWCVIDRIHDPDVGTALLLRIDELESRRRSGADIRSENCL